MSTTSTPLKWQPVTLVINTRLECRCGALAVFVTGEAVDGEYNSLEHVDVWCQECFSKAQREEEQR